MEQVSERSTEFSFGHVKIDINLSYPKRDFVKVAVT